MLTRPQVVSSSGQVRLVVSCRCLLSVSLLTICISTCLAQDARCYLSDSSSTANFFVSENAAVNSVLGVLPVVGDPSLDGDIVLSLDRRDYPVTIVNGSSNITLTRKLDKEGKDGPSSVAVKVICDRRGTNDPGIVIPVNIRVRDENDNAPQFIGDPYTLNISEVTVPGTVVLQGIKAVDGDQRGPFSTVYYSILESNYAKYIDFANGLDGTLRLKRQLDYETTKQFKLTLRAQDQGSPPLFTEAILTVNVIDADDQNPKFGDEKYFVTLPASPLQGQQLVVKPRAVRAYDQDVGINAPVSFSFTSDGAETHYFSIDPDSGVVSVADDIPPDQLTQPVTLVIKAVQRDNTDRYSLTTLTVSRDSVFSERLQFVQQNYVASVLENRPVDSVILTLITNRPSDKSLKFELQQRDTVFRVNSGGQLVLRSELDYETRDKYSFNVTVTDARQSDTASVTVIVLNINDWDPRFRHDHFDFIAPAGVHSGSTVGRLTVYDGDRGDRISVGLMGPDARSFSVSTDGDLVVSDMSRLNSSLAHLVAVARDSGVPPRRSSVPITVRFPQQLVGASVQAESSALLMIILGILLGVLLLIVLTLTLYICKYKKTRSRNRVATPALDVKDGNYLSHEKLSIESSAIDRLDGSSVEISSAILERGDGRQFSRHMPISGSMRNPLANGGALGSQISLNGAEATSSTSASASVNGGSAHTRHQTGGGRSGGGSRRSSSSTTCSVRGQPSVGGVSFKPGVSYKQNGVAVSPAWPDGSIPKRVKKLSWEDEQNRSWRSLRQTGRRNKQARAHSETNRTTAGAPAAAPAQTELDPDVSVTPLPNIMPDSDTLSNAVFF